jgi:hypothetical protein
MTRKNYCQQRVWPWPVDVKIFSTFTLQRFPTVDNNAFKAATGQTQNVGNNWVGSVDRLDQADKISVDKYKNAIQHFLR